MSHSLSHSQTVKSSSPAGYMVLQYDAHTGDVVPRSSSLPGPSSPSSEVRDEVFPAMSPRYMADHRLNDAANDYPISRRRNGALGSVVRRIFPTRPERVTSSSISAVIQQPPAPKPVRPNGSFRPNSNPGNETPLQSPLAAHPLAVADAGDTAARITQFLGHAGDARTGAKSGRSSNTPVRNPNEDTWYRTRAASAVSSTDFNGSEMRSPKRSSISSRGTQRRSRSIGTLSEISSKRSNPRLRPQKSDRNLSTIKETGKLINTSSDDVGMTAYQSQSSGTPFASIADLGRVPPLPAPMSDATMSVVPPLDSDIEEEDRSPVSAQPTFDYWNLVDAMQQKEQVDVKTLHQRLKMIEVKVMTQESSIAKLQASNPPVDLESCPSPTTYDNAASEAVRLAQLLPSPVTLQGRSFTTDLRLTAAMAQPQPSTPSATGSSASTVRPLQPSPSSNSGFPHIPESDLAASTDGLERQINAARAGDSVLTVEHYATLVNLLSQEQKERKALAGQVEQLQMEMRALRGLLPSAVNRPAPASNTPRRPSRETPSMLHQHPLMNSEQMRESRLAEKRRKSSLGSSDKENSGSSRSSHKRGRSSANAHIQPLGPKATAKGDKDNVPHEVEQPLIIPFDEGRFDEADLITPDTPAGQAF